MFPSIFYASFDLVANENTRVEITTLVEISICINLESAQR